jgi:serine/threonine protein phosphatase PrpC
MTDTPQDQPHDGSPALRLRFAALSDVGRHRKDNQDSGYASERLLVVADGVGGAAFGDVASSTAVQLLRKLDDEPTDEMLPLLAGAVHRVHDRLAELVEHDKELDGTSTTVTAAMFDGRRLGFAHVGDSRAYLLRGGELRQLTADHTFVQTLIDEGRITEAEAKVHPHRNIILRAVDGVHDTEPDLFHLALEPGDRVLLCSDGCTGGVDDAGIARLLAEGNVDSAALTLVQAALDGGSTDNVTVVVAEVVTADAPDDPDLAAATTGPMLVGAAAAQPRRGAGTGRGMFRRQSDTDEIDPVPDAPATEPVDPEELRYAPRPPRRFLAARRLALVLVPLILLAGGIVFGYVWSQNQYYVAADGDQVAIYQGVQMDLPLVSLSSLHQGSDVVVAELPCFDQEQVQAGIEAGDLAAAERIVTNLEEQAAQQREQAEADARREARQAAEEARQQNRTGSNNGGNDIEPTPSPSPTEVDATVDCSETGTSTGAVS